jgi:glycosyltransferase involved in cell wall biosynthesis
MIYKSSDLAIIIPSINFQNIKTCLNSIKNQTKKPGQTIVVFNKKKQLKVVKKLFFHM